MVSVAFLLLGVATDDLTWIVVVSVRESEVSVASAGRRVVPVVHTLGTESGLAQTHAQGSDYRRSSCRLRGGGP